VGTVMLMFEYKSEILRINIDYKGIKLVKTIVDHVDTTKFDELINARAAEGWELVAYSAVADNVIGRINALVTFRKEK
jgi:hypothetical protein